MPTLAPMATSRSAKLQRVDERVEYALRDPAGLVGRVEVVDEDRELVAAQAGDRVEISQAGREAVGHGDQEASPTRWPRLSLTFLNPSRSTIITRHSHRPGSAGAGPARAGR